MPLLADEAGALLLWRRPELGADIYIGAAVGARRPLSLELPGNGGLRIWDYESSELAMREAMGLAEGMERKHAVYNTGFAGAKVVVNASSEAQGDAALSIDKVQLMKEVAEVLNDLDGTMYTGCDMNSGLEDMDRLSAQCPYVLAGIGNLALNPNNATAFGVVGSLDALVQARFGGFKGTRFLVHGLGNVGSTVARELVAAGATVYACDRMPGRAAQVPGVVDLSALVNSAGEAWTSHPQLPDVDVFVPCSGSGLLSVTCAEALPAKAICGAANLPFASPQAEEAWSKRGVFVPESITSAGAVIADSIEHFDAKGFQEADPEDIYAFTRGQIFETTQRALRLADGDASRTIRSLVPELEERAAAELPAGQRFPLWRATTHAH